MNTYIYTQKYVDNSYLNFAITLNGLIARNFNKQRDDVDRGRH